MIGKPIDIEASLRKETEKWLKALIEKTKNIKLVDEKAKDWIINIDAYKKDCKHFLEKGDMVRAFEAVIYAYGIYETCLNLGMIE